MNYNITVIGDIHGRDKWTDNAPNFIEQSDVTIIVGDYFDSFDIPHLAQIETFKKIISLKDSYGDKLVLLLGNHDYHYLDISDIAYSGYNKAASWSIRHILEPEVKNGNIQIAYQKNNLLFTHAGVTNTWVLDSFPLKPNMNNLADELNLLFKHKPLVFDFVRGGLGQGDTIDNGPLWVRPQQLLKDQIPDYIQVVGHTFVDEPHWRITTQNCNKKPGVIFTDCGNEYHTLIKMRNGNIEVDILPYYQSKIKFFDP